MNSNKKIRFVLASFCFLSMLSTLFLYSQSMVTDPSSITPYAIEEGVGSIKMLPDVALVKELLRTIFNIAKA